MKLLYYLYLGLKSLPIIFIKSIYYLFVGIFNVITIFPRYILIGIRTLASPQKSKNIKLFNKPVILIMIMSLSITIYLSGVLIFSRWAVQKLKIDFLVTDIVSNTEIIEEENENIIETNNSNPTEETTTDVYYPNDYWDYINVPFINVNFKDLKAKNSETVAWIKINNTYVNYPVTQHSDNAYYLKHDYKNNYNPNGWIYGDYRDNFNNYNRNTIIYGHNLNNRTMFGSLTWTLNTSWQSNSNNHIIKISTPTNNTNWKIFSIYLTEPDAYYLKTTFQNDEEYQIFLNNIKGKSYYDFSTDIINSDKILTLSTCDDTGTKRIVIHAKMINISYK